MAKKSSSYLLPMLILLLVPVLIIAGAGILFYFGYQNKKAELESKIAALPKFNEVKEGEDIAAKLGFVYPVLDPQEKYQVLDKKVKSMVAAKVEQKFSSKLLSKKMIEIREKYSAAKIGQVIEVQLTNNVRLREPFWSKEKSTGGIYIKLGPKKYRLDQIMDNYYYLFDSKISDILIRKKIRALDRAFKAGRRKYAKKLMEEYGKKVFIPAGYSLDSKSRWVPNTYYFREALKKQHEKFNKERLEKIRKLCKEYRFLGFIPVDKAVANPVPAKKEKAAGKDKH